MSSRTVLEPALAAAAMVLPLLVLGPTSAFAVNLVTGPAPDRVTAGTDLPAGRALVTLENPASQPAAVLRPEPKFRDASGGDPVDADWSRVGDGHLPDPDGTFTLEAGRTATFEARGTFPHAGVWETTIEVPGADGARKRIVLAVTRTAAAIPDELILEPQAAQIDVPFPWLTTQAVQRVTLAARNASAGPVAITAVGAGGIMRVANGTTVAVALPQAPSAETSNCSGTLRAKQGCQLTIALPAGLGAGHYAVDASLRGDGDGQSQRTQLVDVRLSAWWAGLLVVCGALAGALLDTWRNSGRTVVVARIAAAQRAARVGKLSREAQSPAARRAVKVLRQALGGLDDRLRRGEEVTPEFSPYDERFAAIAAAVAAEAEAARIPPEAAALLAPRAQELARSLQAAAQDIGAPGDSSGLAGAAAALRMRAEAAVALISTATEARALAASAGAMLRGLLKDVDSAWKALDDGISTALLPLQAGDDEGTLPARQAALQGKMGALNQALAANLPSKLEESVSAALQGAEKKESLVTRAKQLAEKWSDMRQDERLLEAERLARDVAAAGRATSQESTVEAPAAAAPVTSVPSLLAGDSGLVLRLDGLLRGPAGPASLQALEAFRDRWDRWTNLIVLGAIGIVGVLTLWVDAPAWGTVPDLLTAALAGAGTRVALGLVTQRA